MGGVFLASSCRKGSSGETYFELWANRELLVNCRGLAEQACVEGLLDILVLYARVILADVQGGNAPLPESGIVVRVKK